jgi:pseudouridine synthase
VRKNGEAVSLGDRATPGVDVVEVDGIPVTTGQTRRYFILNKPAGVVTTTDDPQGRKTVLDFIDEADSSAVRLFPVGRLDMDSSGLILLTNDGFLANRLLHPRFEVTREYRVEVEPEPRAEHIAMLRKGVELEDGPSGPARVSLIGRREGRGLVGMTLHTGRKRQIRRSFEHLGYRVITLCRVRFGSIGLGSLKPGQIRELEPSEVRELYRRTGLSG